MARKKVVADGSLPVRMIHAEGSEGFPSDQEDVKALEALGFKADASYKAPEQAEESAENPQA